MDFVFENEPLSDGEISLRLHHGCAADPSRGGLPVYYFRICDAQGQTAGWCDLRLGSNDYTYYAGNVGYQIEPPYRGHHYAAKALRLLLGRAKQYALPRFTVSCAVDNLASRKSCEAAGGTLCEIARAKPGLGLDEQTALCIYRFDL